MYARRRARSARRQRLSSSGTARSKRCGGVDLEVARGRAGRFARPERCREIDARQDRVRSRSADDGARGGLRRARRLARGSRCTRVSRRAVPLSRLDDRRRAARAASAARRLATAASASAATLLELVGLQEARRRPVEAMSKGMQQRLGIAQALVGSPRLLLLDEPTSALDPVGRRTVRALLEELQRRGVSVLLNSHLLSEIELVCDRVVDPPGRTSRERRHAGRAGEPARCRDRDGRRQAHLSRAQDATTSRV